MKGNASILSGRIPASPDSFFLKKALYKLILGFYTKKEDKNNIKSKYYVDNVVPM